MGSVRAPRAGDGGPPSRTFLDCPAPGRNTGITCAGSFPFANHPQSHTIVTPCAADKRSCRPHRRRKRLASTGQTERRPRFRPFRQTARGRRRRSLGAHHCRSPHAAKARTILSRRFGRRRRRGVGRELKRVTQESCLFRQTRRPARCPLANFALFSVSAFQ